MKINILALLFVFIAACCAKNAHAAVPMSSGSTTGLGDDTVSQSLTDEFAKCSAYNDIAARCVRKSAREQPEKAAAKHEDDAKRFYKGGYILAGQEFTRKRIKFHNTALSRNAGQECEGFPALEQQYRKRCDDTYKRLPRKLQ